MLKKTIKFQDLDGNQLEEDFYFNISKADLAELDIVEAKNGGMAQVLERIVAEEDGKKIVELLNKVIKTAYGVRSSDNRRFIKNEEVWEDFYHTDAHSELLFELYSNPQAAAAFIRGISPVDVSDKMEITEGMTAEEIRKQAVEAMQGHKSKES